MQPLITCTQARTVSALVDAIAARTINDLGRGTMNNILWHVRRMKQAFRALITLAKIALCSDELGQGARLAGLEPATGCLEGSCSIRLSYRRLRGHCARRRSHRGHAARFAACFPAADCLSSCPMPRRPPLLARKPQVRTVWAICARWAPARQDQR